MRILSSGGITFNGDTSSGNALDDYEEGDFTPALSGSGGTSGQSYSQQDGKYTKIGNIVYITALCELSDKGTITGVVRLSGFPYTPTGSPLHIPFSNYIEYGALTSGHTLRSTQYGGNPFCYLYEHEQDANSAATQLYASQITDGTRIGIMGFYRTTA
jgi:hypothetical protein